MKRFSFRLESVLKYRENLQKQAERDLYRTRMECTAVESAITRMLNTRRQIARNCSEKEKRGIDVPSYQVIQLYLRKIDHDLSKAYDELKKIQEKIKEKTDALNAAVIKKKTLETMKTAQRKAYLELIEKENQKAADELTIMRREYAL